MEEEVESARSSLRIAEENVERFEAKLLNRLGKEEWVDEMRKQARSAEAGGHDVQKLRGFFLALEMEQRALARREEVLEPRKREILKVDGLVCRTEMKLKDMKMMTKEVKSLTSDVVDQCMTHVPWPKIEAMKGCTSTAYRVASDFKGGVFSAHADGMVRIWDFVHGKEIDRFAAHKGIVFALHYSTTGRLITGATDRLVKAWDVKKQECLVTLQGHRGPAWDIAEMPDGRLITASLDSTIKIWEGGEDEKNQESPLMTLKGHSGGVRAVVPLDSERIASGGEDGEVRIWDLSSSSAPCLHTLCEHDGSVMRLKPLPGGRLASGSVDGTIKIWDLSSLSCVTTIDDHVAGSLYHGLCPINGRHLLAGTIEGRVVMYSVKTGKFEKEVGKAQGGRIFDMIETDRGIAIALEEGGRVALLSPPLWSIAKKLGSLEMSSM